jgi:hypothetical protein
MLAVSCPRCDREMRAPDEYVGKTAECSNCGHKFIIEGAPTAAIELAPLPPASRASSPPPLPREKQWHYAVDGVRLGPAGAAEMSSLIAVGRITPRTLVWCEGMGDWKEVCETELLGSSTPPPLPGQSPPTGPAWVLAVLPSVFLLVFFLGMAVSTESDGSTRAFFLTLFLLLMANAVCFELDLSRLRGARNRVPSWTWATPVPIYLFIRASTLCQRPIYAYVWILGCALWILSFTQISWSLPAALLSLACAAICRLAALFGGDLIRESYKA